MCVDGVICIGVWVWLGFVMGCRLDVGVLAFCVSSVFCDIFSQWGVKK